MDANAPLYAGPRYCLSVISCSHHGELDVNPPINFQYRVPNCTCEVLNENLRNSN